MMPSHFVPIKERTLTLPNGKVINDFGYTELLRYGVNKMKDSEYAASLLGNVAIKEVDQFAKTDDVWLQTSTTGAVNPIYGAAVYSYVNNQANFFAALAKQPWVNSGIRIKTANPSTTITGMGETDALPASTLPTYALLRFPLKQMATRMDWTAKMQRVSASGDDTIPTPSQLQQDVAEAHALGLNTSLLSNAETEAANATANYAGVSVFESIDRIISADAEEDDLGGTHSNWYDPYITTATIDRDSDTTYDSVVVHGDGTLCYQTGNPTFTADATLTLDAKDVLLQNCLKNGLKKENAFWLTGWDTYFRLKQLYEVKERYMNPVNVSFSVNGVQTQSGQPVGFGVPSMDDIPIIIDQNCPKDTISKLFLIDRSNIFLRIATPTTAIDLGYPAFSTSTSLAQRLGYGKVLLTEGEIVCTRFNTSGKLCALK